MEVIMGHERIGFLPKRQSWNKIVSLLGQFDNDPELVSCIADQTLENIRNVYKTIAYDESVIKAIRYLTILSFSAKEDNQQLFMNNNGIDIDKDISLFNLARSIKNYIRTETDSLEINKLACDALLETIAKYEHINKNTQKELFSEQNANIWHTIGNGSSFCELARYFFASFTDRHLRYFIDREAAQSIDSVKNFNKFQKTLNDQIIQHSYETAKIMQSFAAGWFNKHIKDNIPTNEEIISFLKLSFEKMREEFRREALRK
jgi:methionyl-tRNA synthetase